MEPAVQTFTFNLPIVPAGTTATIYADLSQVASLLNRRFYRQGINWAVAGFKVSTGAGSLGSVTVSKLPNTWVMSNAWTKSFKTWQKMNNEALAENESVRPRFLDFKIYADSTHHALGFTNNLLPVSLNGAYAPGEWESSKIHVPFATATGGIPPNAVQELELIATGSSFAGISPVTGINSVSLIEGYAASRALPDVVDPNVPGDNDDTDGTTPENWMAALFNEGTQQIADVLTDMSLENNKAPYPFEGDGVNTDTQYPGGANQGPGLQLHDSTFITTTTIGGDTRLKGGNFPCGLVRIDYSAFVGSQDSQFPVLQIDLIPGSHRGYLCEPMTEM